MDSRCSKAVMSERLTPLDCTKSIPVIPSCWRKKLMTLLEMSVLELEADGMDLELVVAGGGDLLDVDMFVCLLLVYFQKNTVSCVFRI